MAQKKVNGQYGFDNKIFNTIKIIFLYKFQSKKMYLDIFLKDLGDESLKIAIKLQDGPLHG